ncbi:MAG: glycosyl hydrolase [Opitutales bacterium]
MYTETDGSRKAIGDIDVLFNDGLYHLFHLVLPNHDFIAHAVSTDGVNWRRVRNSLFIGDPGSWDDLMLWTMHVSPDPHQAGRWRMFYTGLTRRDRGRVQRIGLAYSDDLYRWEKAPVSWKDDRGLEDPPAVKAARELSAEAEATAVHAPYDAESCLPLQPDAAHYESTLAKPRHWVSFRDPFYCRTEAGAWLLASARVNEGPLVRRGCVALLEETAPHHFESRPTLCHPHLYDDIEVPNYFVLEGHPYLIGSIREDAKVRYWHGGGRDRPWRSYHDNVLMPQGNYAGRVCHDEKGWLLWSFYVMDRRDRTANNLMPPPKRLRREPSGLLYLETFEYFERLRGEALDARRVRALKSHGMGDHCRAEAEVWEIASEASFQGFVFDECLENFWLEAALELQGKGKCGLLFRIDPESHDGYYLSLDLLKGVAQLRAWGTDADGEGEDMMFFETLQSAFWHSKQPGRARLSLLTYGSYLELSIDGRVALSLVDRRFQHGYVGVYLETATLRVSDLCLHRMPAPVQRDDQLVKAD